MGSYLNPAGYMGDFHQVYGSGPELGQPIDLSGISFFGNIFFLQTISVPIYGSNFPLWSIANEFWYYLLFPLILSVFLIRGVMQNIVSMILVIAILVALPKLLIFQGLSWLLGAGIFFAQQRKVVNEFCSHPLFLCVAILFPLIVLLLIRFGIFWIFLTILFRSRLHLSLQPVQLERHAKGFIAAARLRLPKSHTRFTLCISR
jgi:hypothetical protein